MKRILLTGARGFIGRHVLEVLKLRGNYEIHALASSPGASSSEGIIWHTADILDERQICRLLEHIRPAYLMHFAWYTVHGLYWESEENLKWEKASRALIKNFFKNGGQRLVGAGTCAEYSWQSGVLSERTTPLVPASLYGQCKQRLGIWIENFCLENKYSAAWGRIFFLYGPHEHPTRLVPSMINAILKGQEARLTYPDRSRDFLYVKDAADAFVSLMESPVQGPVNIASGQPVSLRKIVDGIRREIGESIVHYGTGEDTKEPPILAADTKRLNHEVGWKPRGTLENGLLETIAWWRSHHDESRR